MKMKLKFISAALVIAATTNVNAGVLTMTAPEPTGIGTNTHIASFRQDAIGTAGSFNDTIYFNLTNPLSVVASFALGTGWDSFTATYGGSEYHMTSGQTFSLPSTIGLTSYSLSVTGNRTQWSNGGYTIEFNGSVASVPEPETFAMLLAGLGVVGAIARRRNKKANAA